jgi:hypothetical protein
MGKRDPFISDDSAGIYFWRSGTNAQLSNRPHALLPFHCEFHGWWSDRECDATHGPLPLPSGARVVETAEGYAVDWGFDRINEDFPGEEPRGPWRQMEMFQEVA